MPTGRARGGTGSRRRPPGASQRRGSSRVAPDHSAEPVTVLRHGDPSRPRSPPSRRASTSSSWARAAPACRQRSRRPRAVSTRCCLEKSSHFGGSTARSGGGVWIPNNYALQAAGQGDDPEPSSLPRLRSSATSSPVRRDTYPRARSRGARLHPARTRCASPGCRSTPTTTRGTRGRAAGRSAELSRWTRVPRRGARASPPPVHEGAGQPDRHPGRLPQDQPGLRTVRGPSDDGQGALCRIVSLPCGQRCTRWATRSPSGCARADGRGVPVHYDTELTDLVIEDGRVVGVRARRDGDEAVVRRPPRRDPRQRRVSRRTWRCAKVPAAADVGRLDDRIVVQHRRRDPRRDAAGAQTDLMDDAWWGADDPAAIRSVVLPGRAQPAGPIIVNQAGQRFA